jgi:hypothetical protein
MGVMMRFMRPAVSEVRALGRLPSDRDATEDELRTWQDALEVLEKPLTDDEAMALVKALPLKEDAAFGFGVDGGSPHRVVPRVADLVSAVGFIPLDERPT